MHLICCTIFDFLAVVTNDLTDYSNLDNSDQNSKTNEQDRSLDWTPTHLLSSHLMFNKQRKVHFNRIFSKQ